MQSSTLSSSNFSNGDLEKLQTFIQKNHSEFLLSAWIQEFSDKLNPKQANQLFDFCVKNNLTDNEVLCPLANRLNGKPFAEKLDFILKNDAQSIDMDNHTHERHVRSILNLLVGLDFSHLSRNQLNAAFNLSKKYPAHSAGLLHLITLKMTPGENNAAFENLVHTIELKQNLLATIRFLSNFYNFAGNVISPEHFTKLIPLLLNEIKTSTDPTLIMEATELLTKISAKVAEVPAVLTQLLEEIGKPPLPSDYHKCKLLLAKTIKSIWNNWQDSGAKQDWLNLLYSKIKNDVSHSIQLELISQFWNEFPTEMQKALVEIVCRPIPYHKLDRNAENQRLEFYNHFVSSMFVSEDDRSKIFFRLCNLMDDFRFVPHIFPQLLSILDQLSSQEDKRFCLNHLVRYHYHLYSSALVLPKHFADLIDEKQSMEIISKENNWSKKLVLRMLLKDKINNTEFEKMIDWLENTLRNYSKCQNPEIYDGLAQFDNWMKFLTICVEKKIISAEKMKLLVLQFIEIKGDNSLTLDQLRPALKYFNPSDAIDLIKLYLKKFPHIADRAMRLLEEEVVPRFTPEEKMQYPTELFQLLSSNILSLTSDSLKCMIQLSFNKTIDFLINNIPTSPTSKDRVLFWSLGSNINANVEQFNFLSWLITTQKCTQNTIKLLQKKFLLNDPAYEVMLDAISKSKNSLLPFFTSQTETHLVNSVSGAFSAMNISSEESTQAPKPY